MEAEEHKEKRVVDEVSGWLRVFDDGSVDRTWTGPREVLFLVEPVAPCGSPRDGVTLHDLPGDPSLRLYVPEIFGGEKQQQKPLPILLHFHGGGFCFSRPDWLMYHYFYSRLARSVPAVIVSVDLPLAPEHRLPAAIDTAFAALLRLRSLASSRPPLDSEADAADQEILWATADFSRVFLIGDSSGGNLVHEVAARAGKAEEEEGLWPPLKVAGGILIHPGFVRSTRSRSELEVQSDSVFFTLEMIDKCAALALPEGSTKDHPYTCPMGDAAPPLEGLRLPPFLVGVAEGDLLRDTNLEYCEAMKRAGKEVEVVVSKGERHCFYLNKIAVDTNPNTAQQTEALVLAIKDFIDRH